MNTTLLLLLAGFLAGYAVASLIYCFLRLRPRLQAVPTTGPQQSTAPMDDNGTLQQENGENQAIDGLNPVLSRAVEEWHYTFDAIVDPVLILDTNLQIVKGNQAAVQLLSANGASIEGKYCYQLFSGLDEICPFCPMQALYKEKKACCHEVTHRYLGRTFMISGSPLFDRGEIVGFVYSAKDISHQRNLEKRLVHAHKLESIATLAGGIAHDFNNILGAILGNADLLLFRLPSTDDQNLDGSRGPTIQLSEITEHLQAIRRAGIRAKDLVAQILAFSRQSSNLRRDLLIAPVVKESCRLLRSTLPATIDLHVSVHEGIGMIHADPSQIQQVLMHLCTNAAQSLEKNTGTIEISLRESETGRAEQLRYHNLAPGRYVVLTIKDNGRGIAPETLERIFDPFFTTKEVGQGSGMGLAVLHGIITAHDGVIDVTSTLGKGTVFTIFFPRVPDPPGEGAEMGADLPCGNETILFVDDEIDIVNMRTRMLSLLGYRVLPATSPEQALDYCIQGRERIDLLITDHTMPRITGLQLAAEFSSLMPGLPIILCSGYSEAITLEEAQQAGVCRFLEKPVDMRLLALAIREILPAQDGGER